MPKALSLALGTSVFAETTFGNERAHGSHGHDNRGVAFDTRRYMPVSKRNLRSILADSDYSVWNRPLSNLHGLWKISWWWNVSEHLLYWMEETTNCDDGLSLMRRWRKAALRQMHSPANHKHPFMSTHAVRLCVIPAGGGGQG